MSSDEQDAAILRLVRHRGESKKRKALLESQLRAAGKSLCEIGSSLKSVSTSGSFNDTPECILPQIAKAPEICNLERIKTELEELSDLEKILVQLNRSASDLGVDYPIASGFNFRFPRPCRLVGQ